jgi:hypothetical protein
VASSPCPANSPAAAKLQAETRLTPARSFRDEYALPERELLPAEQAWSNIMDPKAAAQLLEEQP